MMKIKKVDFESTIGTSFWGVTIKASKKALASILFEPEHSENDKINYEWNCNTGEFIFTICDYKLYREIDDTEILDWHIGTIFQDQSVIAKEMLEDLLNAKKLEIINQVIS